MDNSGGQQPRLGPASSSQQHLPSKSSTYLAKIAVVLRGSPNQMLTFTELMQKLAPTMREDRKSLENNIRVCLSVNSCFVKVPVDPDLPTSKRNYWKLDCHQMTEKMVRRHFKGLLPAFPELASKLETEKQRRPSRSQSDATPRPPRSRAVQTQPLVRFSGPFSIDSILSHDEPPEQVPRSPPLGEPARRRQQLPLPARGWVPSTSVSWEFERGRLVLASAGGQHKAGGSTRNEVFANGAAPPIQMMRVHTEPQFPVYSAPLLPSYPGPSLPSYPEPSLPSYPRSSLPSYPGPSLPSYPGPSLPSYPRPSLPSYPQPSLPFYFGCCAAPYFSSPHSGGFISSVPTFDRNALN